jgi:hypothetical protein
MNRRRYRLEVPAVSDRFIAAFHMRDDDRRRWWVIDTQPSPEAKVGTTVAECLGEGKALEVARMVADVVWDGADRTMTVPWRELTIDRPDPTRVIREGINPDEEPF